MAHLDILQKIGSNIPTQIIPPWLSNIRRITCGFCMQRRAAQRYAASEIRELFQISRFVISSR
jgi:hypothetical protein